VATIDKFQHWIYETPDHSLGRKNREVGFDINQFSDTVTDWSGLQPDKDYLWQQQLHLYEVPFYYLDTGLAQLEPLRLWRNFKTDNTSGLQKYQDALKLGNTTTIPEIYKAAGIKFDFSRAYIHELMSFVKDELGNR